MSYNDDEIPNDEIKDTDDELDLLSDDFDDALDDDLAADLLPEDEDDAADELPTDDGMY